MTDETKVICPDCGKHFMLEIEKRTMYTTKRPEEEFDYAEYKKDIQRVQYADYHGCEHFTSENNGYDVFDHPTYSCYCTKDGGKKELLVPDTQCKRCMEAEKK